MNSLLVALSLVVLLLIGMPGLKAAGADEKTAAVRQDVLSLLDRLAGSACVFYRNGSWYEGSEAAAHLQRKFDYIVRRSELQSAEQFIELGATQSSFSGRAYQVRCGTAEPQASQRWLLEQLEQLRRTSRKSAVGSTSAQ